MPLRLLVGRRTGRYELSRDVFVVSVEGPEDGSRLQATLSDDSTAQDCRDFLADRLSIRQRRLWGLRLRSGSGRWRWAEMGRPLRKQLGRLGCGADTPLRLALFHFLPCPQRLTDPVTRYYYFLQLKSAVMEGRLLVSPERAIALAGFSLQVLLGDQDAELHTVAFLSDFELLPKQLTNSPQILQDLTRQVLGCHLGLRGMDQPTAELRYIQEARACEGYGQEFFPAKESEDGSAVFLGYGLEGLVVKKLGGDAVPLRFKWEKISRICSQKRTLVVELVERNSARFLMEDSEWARYVALICSLQLEFFRDQHTTDAHSAPEKGFDELPSGSPIHEPKAYSSNGTPEFYSTLQNHAYRELPEVPIPAIVAPPAYRPAPDYASALAHPSIAEYLEWQEAFERSQPPPEPLKLSSSASSSCGSSSDSPSVLPMPTQAEEGSAVTWVHTGDVVSCEAAPAPRLPTAMDDHVTRLCIEDSDVVQEPVAVAADVADMGAATVILNQGLALQRPDLLPPPQASKRSNDERLAEMEAVVRRGSVDAEFERLPRKRASAGTSSALRPDSAARNRYSDILPYEDTRVHLAPSRANTLGYVNASNVHLPVADRLLRYIATQGPLKETSTDFWQMVWEAGAHILVMLTKTEEKDTERSFQYWPSKAEGRTKLKFGDYSISLGSSTASKSQVTTSLTLKHGPSGVRRLVYHLHFLAWPVGGIPANADTFLRFMDEVSSVRRHVENELREDGAAKADGGSSGRRWTSSGGPSGSLNSSGHSSTGSSGRRVLGPRNGAEEGRGEAPPVLVHCCSGAGRTGVFLLVDFMIHCLEQNQDMSVPRALTLLRQQRMSLVQTPEQYHFVYDALIAYLANSRLI